MKQSGESSPWKLIVRSVTVRPLLALGAIGTVIVCALAEIAFPWLLQQGIDAAVGEKTAWTVSHAAFAMLAVIVTIVVGHIVALVLEAYMVAGVSFDLRRRIYAHVQRLPLGSLAKYRSGTLAYRTTGDVTALQNGIRDLFGDFSFDILVSAGALLAMLYTDWRLALAVVGVLGIATAIGGRLGKRLPAFQRAIQVQTAGLAGRIQESVSAGHTLRVFGAENRTIRRLDTVSRKIQRMDVRSGLLHALVTPLWHFAEALGIVIVLWYGGHLVVTHTLTVGALIAFLAYLELLSGPIHRFGDYYYELQSCRGIAGRIVTLLAEEPEASGGDARPQADGRIQVNNLWFQYPGAARPVFQGLSFTIEPGEHVAIVGRNGAGKSTLFDLLMRFYLPQQGNILSGETDISAWDTKTWRASVGLMLQDTVLLHGTLAENLEIARPEATREEMRSALQAAGAGPLLARLPDGLDTLIGERGTGFSGGERQLIGLARLALQNPPIVLLDEPTAHLDGAALQTVSAAIAQFAQGRTMLLITHNPETLRLTSRRVVLQEGRIVAERNASEISSLAVSGGPPCAA